MKKTAIKLVTAVSIAFGMSSFGLIAQTTTVVQTEVSASASSGGGGGDSIAALPTALPMIRSKPF